MEINKNAIHTFRQSDIKEMKRVNYWRGFRLGGTIGIVVTAVVALLIG